ncbi:hypothetical protein E1B28_007005 [Marasmius oreades]|uniref:F-box domain-containing protein n=1 Tax=Marasmius oreades TaxID=181124 RepID=A0A9P7S1C3_9AGAR|nr:uncharacterized protein E1B28_007005 [Marasmius oreades]KAG7093323.1 hypothetical protein E1B28_007005 [Marasmius oreades]
MSLNRISTTVYSGDDAEHSLCREEEGESELESYWDWANRVDDVLGTHELEARARYLAVFEETKTAKEDINNNTGTTSTSTSTSRPPLSQPIFPQEIFDIIITYLSDYPRILTKLILVSTKWVPLCRKYLYSSLVFGVEDEFERKCPYPHYVQRMSLISPYGHPNLDWIRPVVRNMERFTALDHVELVDLPWDVLWLATEAKAISGGGPGTNLLTASSVVMGRVSKVFLGGVEIEALEDVAICISRGFPGCKELVVLMEVFEDEGEDEDGEYEYLDPDSDLLVPRVFPFPIPPGLCEFTIQDHPLYPTPTRFWWKWFRGLRFSGLRSVTVGDLVKEDVAFFKVFVDGAAGWGLAHLGVGIGCVGDLDTFTNHRILASCPNLQSFRLTQPVRRFNEEWGCGESVGALYRLFSSFTANHLRVVSLPAVRQWAGEVERGVRVEGALTVERFPALEMVEFCSDVDTGVELSGTN